jgi:hypothetical protein
MIRGRYFKKNLSPYVYPPTANLKTTARPLPRAILDSPARTQSKIALGSVAACGTGYELAVTRQTRFAARLAHARRTCGIFLERPLSKVVDDLDP